MNRTQKRKIQKTTAGALIFGLISATATLLILAFIGAIVAYSLENPTASLGAISFCVLMATGAISGFSTSKYKGEGGVLPAALSAIVFAVILLFVGIIISRGMLPAVTVINLAVFILSAVFFAILGKKKEKRRKRK